MIDRLMQLSIEEDLTLPETTLEAIVDDAATSRAAAYSAYGEWLIRRTRGETDGQSVLALWRKIAWKPEGSPIRNFRLTLNGFSDAESTLLRTMRASI